MPRSYRDQARVFALVALPGAGFVGSREPPRTYLGDRPKARIIADLLAPVDDDLAAALVEKVIEQAEQWTTSQLRARLRRLVMAADPQAVAKKAREGIRSRRVVAYPDPDSGLASLAGYELAPFRVAAVMERLDAIARAAKAAGDGVVPAASPV